MDRFTVKEITKGQFAVVEGDRIVAPFGTRKGLAQAYAKRIQGKETGYDPKAGKPAKPAKVAIAKVVAPAPAK